MFFTIKHACAFFVILSTFIGINSILTFWKIAESTSHGRYREAFFCNYSKRHEEAPDLSKRRRNVPKRNMYSVQSLDLWLSSALLDKRKNETWVHIFGTERKDIVKGDFVCKWNYSEKSTDEVQIESKAKHSIVDASWPHWGPIFACRFSCKIPEGSRIPKHIQLTSSDGKIQSQEMPIASGANSHPQKTLAVCVKPMTGQLKVIRLVEWFETLRAAGIEQFIMYHTDVGGNGRYVLEYYQQIGILNLVSYPYLFSVLERVDTLKANLNGQDRYAVYQQVYLAAMQDCLYRFQKSFKHILFMDLDEVLLPTKNESLVSMLAKIDAFRNDTAGYIFLTAWHFEEFGAKKDDKGVEDFYIQKYVESTEPIDNQPKCITNTDLADSVNFHGVLTTRGDKFKINTIIPWAEFGYLHHFRGRCDEKFEKKQCDEELLPKHRQDPVLLRYRDQVLSNTRKVMGIIQLH